MTNFKNMKSGVDCMSAEAQLADEILHSYVDNHDEIPEGTRIVVMVSTGTNNGRMGCAFEGYDENETERLMLDLSLMARAVDLGVKP